MRRRLGYFVVDAFIANVVPTLIALVLHERNVRKNSRNGMGLYLEGRWK